MPAWWGRGIGGRREAAVSPSVILNSGSFRGTLQAGDGGTGGTSAQPEQAESIGTRSLSKLPVRQGGLVNAGNAGLTGAVHRASAAAIDRLYRHGGGRASS